MKSGLELKEGKLGDWEVIKFLVSPEDEGRQRVRSMFQYFSRYVPAGEYYVLTHNNHIVMSNTPDEISDNLDFIHNAHGNVLINGLGLGVVIDILLKRTDTKHITVIEISPEVIELVGSQFITKYGTEHLTIINADALEYKPPKGSHYHAVWHDIWDNITSNNLPEMHKLHRRYGRICDWQGSWCRGLCEYYKRVGY